MKCLNCGKEFTPKSYNRRYCCDACGEKYRKTHKEGALYPSVTFRCSQCGRVVVTDGKKDKRTRFCSVTCERKFWKHPHWENPSTRINFRSIEEYAAYEKRTNEL